MNKLSKRAHKDKECVKVHYEILLVMAENVVAGAPVYVQWKRGSKNENKGESKHVAVKDKKVIFENSMISFDSTLYKQASAGNKKQYEAKNMSITLKEEKGKKGVSLAKTVIDLAEFAGKDERRSFSLKSKKSKLAPSLTLHFKSKERELAPGEDITETDGVLTEDNASDEEDSIEDFTDDRDDVSTKSDKSDKRGSLSLSKSSSSAPSTPVKDSKRDSVSSIGSLDTEQLRAELEKAKKRTKELATENVEFEDKIKDLTKELEDAKKSKASPGPLSSEKEADLRKKIKELTQENSEKDDTIKKLKKEIDEKGPVGSPGGLSAEKEQQMKQRLKELATENVDLEEQVNDLKKELEDVKAQGGKKGDREEGLQKQVQEELRRKIKELTRANEDTEEEVEALKKQVEQLKKTPSAAAAPAKDQSDEIKKLQIELREKDDKISDLEDEVGLLLRKMGSASSSSSSSDSAVQEYKDKIDSLKDKLRSQQDESDRKLDEARSVELDLRDRIRDLEDAAEEGKLKSSSSRGDKDKYEREAEKEKDARKKAEKEVRELRDKLEDLERSSKGSGKSSSSNGTDTRALERELEREKAITAAVYAHTGHYSSEEGIAESALAVWELVAKAGAHTDSDEPEARAVADRVVEVLQSACTCTPNDMNMLFYWLSTTSALLHMLRDEPDAESNNDRDPIIDGVYQPTREPSSSSSLQDRLEWLSFSVYKQLVTLICTKLTPVLAPVIIEKQLTDKKTQVSTSPVMRILDRVLARTRHHYLYDAVVQQLFVQIFYFISCHLVNTILQKNKLTPTIGFQIKLGLSHLEDWLSQPSGSSSERALLAPCHAQLDGVRDVGGVLVLDKALLTDASTLQSIFKVLNLKQIRRLLEVFEPDQLAQGGLPPSVRDAMASTWNTPNASSLPVLFDQSKLLAFTPQFD